MGLADKIACIGLHKKLATNYAPLGRELYASRNESYTLEVGIERFFFF